MIGRPTKSEAAEYYFTYIDQVKGDDIQVVLATQLEESPALFTGISEDKSLHRYSPGKWSIRQVLNHISDTERSLAFRALWFGRNFSTPLPSYDQNIAASAAEADGISWAAHIEEFRRVRLATISLLANLPSEGWMRTGVASDNLYTVRALAYIIAGHYAHHVKILNERYL
jgi:uncharacterized damage-inducible protein DinB